MDAAGKTGDAEFDKISQNIACAVLQCWLFTDGTVKCQDNKNHAPEWMDVNGTAQ